MPNQNEAMSSCPVCGCSEVEATRIQSAIPFKSGTGMENRSHSDSAVYFNCPKCGEFVITDQDCINLKSPRSHWNWHHLSALIREQTICELPPFWIRDGMDPYGPIAWNAALTPINVKELLGRWPRTVGERIDRTLCNLARLSPIACFRITVNFSDTALAFALAPGEATYHINALTDMGFLKRVSLGQGTPTVDFIVTPLGWSRFEELTRGNSSPENPAFVAMCFGEGNERPAMDKLYLEGIQCAIEQAGYHAIRSDLVEHNDWIMDKIMGDIRLAPFIVADFTGQRNGVYFEAGFARGLGKTVIHTCRKDCMKDAHFDTAQLNHIVWTTPDELCKKLTHRIKGTIGQGPNPIS